MTNVEVFREDDGVTRIVLSRPKVRNAISVEAVVELRETFTATEEGGDTRAVVLHGAEGSFCAGADLALVRAALDGDPPSVLEPLVTELHDTIRVIRGVPFPVVAAVEGFAVGAGMGLALAADVRIADPAARLVPGYFGIGASPDGGVSYFLTRALGATRATSLILHNRPLDADTMASLGLVERIAEPGQAVAAAVEHARSLTNVPPLALVRMRRLVDSATTMTLSEQLDAERALVAELWATTDFREGVSSFVERRTPHFTGR